MAGVYIASAWLKPTKTPGIQTGEPPLLVAAASLKHSAEEIKEVIRAELQRASGSGV